MGERGIGVTIGFTLVSLVALSISFYAAAQMNHKDQQVGLLKVEVERLSQNEKALRGSLQEAESKYVDETRKLRSALVQEEVKSMVLTQEMQQGGQRRIAQNAEATESKNSSATNFTSKNFVSKKE